MNCTLHRAPSHFNEFKFRGVEDFITTRSIVYPNKVSDFLTKASENWKTLKDFHFIDPTKSPLDFGEIESSSSKGFFSDTISTRKTYSIFSNRKSRILLSLWPIESSCRCGLQDIGTQEQCFRISYTGWRVLKHLIFFSLSAPQNSPLQFSQFKVLAL